MVRVVVGKWGKNLAIRVPATMAAEAGLREREAADLELHDHDLTIHRPDAKAQNRRRAEGAAAEIEAESRAHRLDGVSMRALLEDGRRG